MLHMLCSTEYTSRTLLKSCRLNSQDAEPKYQATDFADFEILNSKNMIHIYRYLIQFCLNIGAKNRTT